MTPLFLFAVLLGGIYGAIFLILLGSTTLDALYYLPVSIVGFLAGHLLGSLAGLQIGMVGSLQVVTATLGSLAALLLGWWLKGAGATE